MQHPESHDITALAYGLIEGPEREQLLTHLSECDACRAVYDGYREEQATVRDSIVRDARSGAAEAKALESTLRMLGAIDGEDKPRGRLLHLPRWVLIAEVAAMLAVAVGLFFILKPNDEPELVPIAEELRAPAEVSGGVVYVSDRQGEWKPAEAVPEDEWVMAGDDGELLLTLANGSKAKLEPNCVFRVGRDGESQQLMLQFLRGNGVVDTTAMTDNMFVRSGEAGFYAMPEARFSIESVATATQLRSWTLADRVNASVTSGDVVLWPQAAKYSKLLPLTGGDKVEWTPENFKVYTESGKTLPLAFAWHAYSQDAELGSHEMEAKELYTIMLELEPRMEALRKRIKNMPRMNDQRTQELRRYFLPPDEGEEIGVLQIMLEESTGINDSVKIELTENRATRVVLVSTDGLTISVNVQDGRGRESYEDETIDDLKARVPAEILALLEGLTFTKDDKGMHRIEGAKIEGREGVKIKVVSTGKQTAENKD